MNLTHAKEKAKQIVARMTVEEKMSQLRYDAPAIDRLGIHDYNWWNEACHGVARSGVATVFPQSIGMAASFHPALVYEVAQAISVEGRAKYNQSVAFCDRDIFKGLTYWAPNINIFRDPRWGRGQETCGEDPFLTSQIGVSYIRGLQGDGPFYRATACAKHFAVHSGPERLRHSFDAKASKKDMEETYLPAFRKAVDAGVAGVMGAYNRTNGEPCCASETLISDILRGQWGFEGYFVSDCGAINDIYAGHKTVDSVAQAAAAALNAGCDLNCGDAYQHLIEAYEQDLITEEQITAAVERLFTIRALLGEFEDERPFADIPFSVVSCQAHKALNLRAAEETIVLLENKNAFLPLEKNKAMKIAVVGPNAMSIPALEGNYNGHADEYVTVADGVRRTFANAEITVADGAPVYQDSGKRWDGFYNLSSEGAAAARNADLTILCLGLDRGIEGEDLGYDNDYTDFGDRKTLALPACQQQLAEAVCDVCENVIVVVMCGSCVDLGDRVRNHAKAVLHAWYPGAMGGLAVARALAGDFSPSGRLPVTFYRADDPLPDISDYNMKGRTYRFLETEPLYPFGFGLGYTSFDYGPLRLIHADDGQVICETDITNTGETDAWEKAQLYASYSDSRTVTPRLQLCALSPVYLRAGERKTVSFTVDRFWLKAVLADGTRVDPDGGITLYADGCQPTDGFTGLKL